MTDPDSKITITLKGERAQKGISLDAFDGFIKHFTNALRYHYRASKAEPARKPGHPLSNEQLATSFRLVGFRVGSAIAVLSPPLSNRETDSLLESDVPTLAWTNVDDLLATAEAGGHLEDAVTTELESATRCLGKNGSFAVDYRSRSGSRAHTFDLPGLAQLRAPQSVDAPRPHTITGKLHAIDLEPGQVAIRTASGVDWRCSYPDDLEQHVLALIGNRVWARGTGKTTSARAGTLDVAEIHADAVYEQTALFTGLPLPIEELMAGQTIGGPQGWLHSPIPSGSPTRRVSGSSRRFSPRLTDGGRAAPQVILCDTTFVSLQEISERKPEAIAHWPSNVLNRIDSAILAVSVFTLAEIRAGRIAANWGQRRSERQERLLAAYVTVPLDEDILNEYATLHAWSSRGHKTPHNDMWIAATAITRRFPLVSCDEHFEKLAESHELEHIYLPRYLPCSTF